MSDRLHEQTPRTLELKTKLIRESILFGFGSLSALVCMLSWFMMLPRPGTSGRMAAIAGVWLILGAGLFLGSLA